MLNITNNQQKVSLSCQNSKTASFCSSLNKSQADQVSFSQNNSKNSAVSFGWLEWLRGKKEPVNKIDQKTLDAFNLTIKNDPRLEYPVTTEYCDTNLGEMFEMGLMIKRPDYCNYPRFITTKTEKRGDNIKFEFWYAHKPNSSTKPQLEATLNLKTGEFTSKTINNLEEYDPRYVKNQVQTTVMFLSDFFQGQRVYLKSCSIKFPEGIKSDFSGLSLTDLDIPCGNNRHNKD